MDVLLAIARKRRPRDLDELELLHHAGEEQEELLLGQRLTQAITLPNAERDHVVVVDKLSLIVQKSIWIEKSRILKMLWVPPENIQLFYGGFFVKYLSYIA